MKSYHIVVQEPGGLTLAEGSERASREDVALKRFLWAAWAVHRKVPTLRKGKGLMIGIVREE